jgi:mono/diheme cytochrome c family protein
VSRAPKLRGNAYDPNFLYARIANGSTVGASGLVMPAFQTMLPPEEIWKLVAYIMSLSKATD